MSNPFFYKKNTPVRLGISACLLGHSVRYDGGHKNNPILFDGLSGRVIFIPFCPEDGCGLGTPREPMRLQESGTTPRLLTINSRLDHTKLLIQWSMNQFKGLVQNKLHGFLLKSRSPSCGLMGVNVFDCEGHPHAIGVGLFARLVQEWFPQLPIDQGDLLTCREDLQQFLEKTSEDKHTGIIQPDTEWSN